MVYRFFHNSEIKIHVNILTYIITVSRLRANMLFWDTRFLLKYENFQENPTFQLLCTEQFYTNTSIVAKNFQFVGLLY